MDIVEDARVAQFNDTHWYAANVLSHEQLAAYGDYAAARRSLGFELYLLGQVGYDGALPMIEMGHC